MPPPPPPPSHPHTLTPSQVYYKEAVGAFVVFDVTRLSTFEAVQMWKADLDNKVLLANGKPIPAVLLANKVGALTCAVCNASIPTLFLHFFTFTLHSFASPLNGFYNSPHV